MTQVEKRKWAEETKDVEKARYEVRQQYALAYSGQLKTDVIWDFVRGDERFVGAVKEIESVGGEIVLNPSKPTAGKMPPELIGRNSIIQY